MSPLDRFLAALDAHGCKPRRSGDGWAAHCPAHDDKRPSLSIGEGDDGRVLLTCFPGCPTEDVVQAVGLEMRDLFTNNGTGDGRVAQEHVRVRTPRVERATAQHPQPVRSEGLTLAVYAGAKGLEVPYLQTLGLEDAQWCGRPAVRIPYHHADDSLGAERFRISLDEDDRFRWKKGAKPMLYGLDFLDMARRAGYIVLVEGESDCHTLWDQEVPAVGVPGAASWREERDAAHLDGIPKIYVVIEPDDGGKKLLKSLASSAICDRLHLVTLGEFKDPSAMFLAEPARFRARWEQAVADAEPWTGLDVALASLRRRRAGVASRNLTCEERILDRFCDDLAAQGVVGEKVPAKMLYLAVTSRLFEKPVSIAVKGPSSGGKSFVVEQVLRFFPESAYYALSGMSERALAYGDEPLRHRHLVIYEAAGLQSDFASYLLRSLLSEGCVRYETVEKTKEGLSTRLIEREGPTGLIVTTTAVQLHPENETRLLSVTVTDTPEQTKAVMMALANGKSESPDLAPWIALQEYVAAGERRVEIPYAPILAGMVPPVAVRLRRDFGAVLGLIKAHALLHQTSRERDGEGRIVASIEDYEVVRELVGDIVSEGLEATVPPTVRETVEVVERLLAKGADEGISITKLATALGLDKGSASRRWRNARDRGYLVNREDRKGRPARLKLGDPLPMDLVVLPTPEAVRGAYCAVAGETERVERAPP